MIDVRKGVESVRIRRAVAEDTDAVFALGLRTPELQVSYTAEFMGRDELVWSITKAPGVFLVAEVDGAIIGFLFASIADIERPNDRPHSYACLVYLVVDAPFRRSGIALQLYAACEHLLRERGTAYVYAWASEEGDGAVLAFADRQGFTRGHRYIWVDKQLTNDDHGK
ncbi:MAG: GNAT family N-acetyltransferase [bacterium]|nr:GNAT family N-acetyltransferase [bacterium]